MQFFRDLYFTRVSFLGSTHDFTQVQVNIVLFTLLHIYPYISKMIPQFVVSLSNRIGLCRPHWLGQPISNHLQLSAKVNSMVRF